MKNEKELSERYFGDRDIPSRRKMWDKIESLSAKVEEIQDLRLADSTKQHNDLLACYEVFNSLQTENQQLKQSQNQKAIEELEKLKLSILDFSNGYWHYFNKTGDAYITSEDLESCLKEFIDNQIKELEGENER